MKKKITQRQMPWKKKDVKKGNKQQGRNHILNWVGVQGGVYFWKILENFRGVPNFWVCGTGENSSYINPLNFRVVLRFFSKNLCFQKIFIK